MVAWSMKRYLGGYWNIKSNYLIMRAFSLYTGSECMRLFEVYAEKIIANAGSFALAIILFFGIYEVTVIFGFT